MATKNYTTRTASLKATKADITKLDVKQLTINGEPLKSTITIKDERETITENDIWPNPINAEVEHLISNTDGNIVYQGLTNNTFDYSEMTDAQKAITQTVIKVIDNKVLGENDELLMNWDTKNFTNNNNGYIGDIFGWSSTITEWNSDLSSLTHGDSMFGSLTALKTFNSDLSKMTDGRSMFYYCEALETFNGDLSSLTNGNRMFGYTNLTSFDSDLSSLTDGQYMFWYCTKLTTFNSDLSSLTNGNQMFIGCPLTSFNSSDLSSLDNGINMFSSTKLTSFNSDLSSLTDGRYMFDGCTALTSFNSDLSSLDDGGGMFAFTSLASFSGDLSSLTDGQYMFEKTKLDAPSLANIIHTINTPTTNGTIKIGLGIDDTDEARLSLAEAIWCNDWNEVNQEFSDKNWTVQWQFNGAPTSAATLDMNTTPSPIWAKLEEVTVDENDNLPPYSYVSEDGSKYFNLHWYHSSNGNNEDYDYFGSLLEACGYFGIVPKEYANEA